MTRTPQRAYRSRPPTAARRGHTRGRLQPVVLTLALLTLGGCAVTGNASTSDGDVVDATRQLVSTVDVAGERVGADLPVLEREVSGPTACLDGDGFQGSIAWTQVLPEDAEPDEVLAAVEEAWSGEGLEVSRDGADPELPRVDAEGADGSRYTAELVRATMTLHHLATTDCRPLPDGTADADVLRASFAERVDPDGEPITQDLSRSLADQVAELRRDADG